ncbi:PPPDE putative thiol peptidase family protein [Euphorbia peplus]|nr:PPPDE putative thiol peptidase family protein [Euphorbia peplus]
MLLCTKNLTTDEQEEDQQKTGSFPVYLNVYDLTPINGYAYWLGLGVYHSGVQVHGIEYAFGAHDFPTTGIFEGEPKQCEGFTFRKTILVGKTEMTSAEVRKVMEDLADIYRGNAYNLITKNCNHFCNDACIRLTGNPIPSWVNRLARIGFFCNCVLPANLNTTKVGHHKMEEKSDEAEKKKFTNESNTSSSSSSSSPPSDSLSRGRSRSRRRALPP